MPPVTTLLGRAFLLLVLALVGCTAATAGLEGPILSTSTKTDDPGIALTPIAELPYGGDVVGTLLSDKQYDAYTFSVGDSAVVTLDNSHRGSAAHLDSALFVYGPRDESGFFGAKAIASDDDTGWGLHARLKELALAEAGEYLVVLALKAGADPGHYRLTLECNSLSCEAEPLAQGNIIVSASELEVDEDGDYATFEVELSDEPTGVVRIWVESDNLNEAVVYPPMLLFCPEGLYEKGDGCATEPPSYYDPEPVRWDRTVQVRVMGIRDNLDDGDATFQLNFTVESEDANYEGESLPSIVGTNFDRANSLDSADLEGLAGQDLIVALRARVDAHQGFGYYGANGARTLLFGSVDVHNGVVESMYTRQELTRPRDAIRAYQLGFNTEHNWPQSQFARVEPIVSDLHHIFACDITSNHQRASFDFGYTSDPENPDSVLGPSAVDPSEQVYQVRPERRGDVARAHFYMVARYGFDAASYPDFDDRNRGDAGYIEDSEEAVLRQWHAEDPVDAREWQRNSRVEAFQGARNPFVDYPELVERIADL